MNWQYIIIAILFVIAVLYLVSKFYNPFSKKSDENCNKGCGCGTSETDVLKSKN